jgi:hypothetical protein
VESPDSWNLLTASLSVCDLEKPEAAWTFLTAQGLVRDNPADRELFFSVVKQEWDRGPNMGPSFASRVADKLKSGNMVLPTAETPDPWGRIAKERWQLRMGGGRSSKVDPG